MDAGGLERFDGQPETPLLRQILGFVREEKDPSFAFLRRPAIPWQPLAHGLPETRVALVSTAGLHRRGEPPFRALEEPLGDASFRVVPHGTPAAELDLEAPYVDPKYVQRDPEVALPLRALEALARAGRVRAAARHYSFCGGILRPFPALRAGAREIAADLRADGVEALLLIPTCSICVHSVALLAGELEELGLSTVALSLLPELSRIVGVPRTLALRFPFGAPCGDPGNEALQQAVVGEALALLAEAERGTVRESALAWRRAPSR
jgi:D-proline reductase (dithiol) PrdB